MRTAHIRCYLCKTIQYVLLILGRRYVRVCNGAIYELFQLRLRWPHRLIVAAFKKLVLFLRGIFCHLEYKVISASSISMRGNVKARLNLSVVFVGKSTVPSLRILPQSAATEGRLWISARIRIALGASIEELAAWYAKATRDAFLFSEIPLFL